MSDINNHELNPTVSTGAWRRVLPWTHPDVQSEDPWVISSHNLHFSSVLVLQVPGCFLRWVVVYTDASKTDGWRTGRHPSHFRTVLFWGIFKEATFCWRDRLMNKPFSQKLLLFGQHVSDGVDGRTNLFFLISPRGRVRRCCSVDQQSTCSSVFSWSRLFSRPCRENTDSPGRSNR